MIPLWWALVAGWIPLTTAGLPLTYLYQTQPQHYRLQISVGAASSSLSATGTLLLVERPGPLSHQRSLLVRQMNLRVDQGKGTLELSGSLKSGLRVAIDGRVKLNVKPGQSVPRGRDPAVIFGQPVFLLSVDKLGPQSAQVIRTHPLVQLVHPQLVYWLRFVFPRLPQKRVAAGESWRVKARLPSGSMDKRYLTLSVRQRFVVERPCGSSRCALISIEARKKRVVIAGRSYQFRLKGHAFLELKSRQLFSAELRIESQFRFGTAQRVLKGHYRLKRLNR